MKALLIATVLFLSSQFLFGQNDTIWANDTHTMALFFPSPIRQAITGSSNFVFSHDPTGKQTLGLLQGASGPGSNLLVLTADQHAYMFELQYEPHLLKTYRHVTTAESIHISAANEHPSDTLTPKMEPLSEIASIKLKKGAEFALDRADGVLKSKRSNNISFRLLNLVYHGREVFLVLEIKNHSRIDYEVAYLRAFLTQGNPGRKASFQKRELPSQYEYNFPGTIRAASSNRFVIVVPKFTLADREKLLIELRESHGSRSITMRY